MYLGSAYTILGEEEKTIEYVKSSLNGNLLTIRIKPSTGYGNQFFGIYVNEVLAKSIYISEGDEGYTVVADVNSMSAIVVLPHGGSQAVNMADIVKLYFTLKRQTVNASWAWGYEVIGGLSDGDDIDFLSNWSLSDLHYRQLYPDTAEKTRGYFNVTVLIDGSDVTVTGTGVDGQVFTGTGTASSTVTLTGLISGSVDVGTPEELTGQLYIRYPKQIQIYRGSSNPPTTQVAIVEFNQSDTLTWKESAILTAGNYYYAYKVLSDTNDLSALSTPELVAVAGLPDAPTGLAYLSGDSAETVLSFTASETVGATYNLYIKDVNDTYFDYSTPAATAIAGSDEITMPAVDYPGTVLAVLRAVYSGEEEKNNNILAIEYDAAGDYVYPRPNNPIIGTIEISGLGITVYGSYGPAGEKGTPTKLQLFARDPDDNYDFDNPDSEGSLSNNKAVLTATLTAGYRYITLKSANTNVQSSGTSEEILIYVSDVDATVSNVSFNSETT